METTSKLVELYAANQIASKKELKAVQELLPIGTVVYYTVGCYAPKTFIVESVKERGYTIDVYIKNPRSGKGRWVGYYTLNGVAEDNYDNENKRHIYDMGWELNKETGN